MTVARRLGTAFCVGWVALTGARCAPVATPHRVPLASPFPLTYGGTVVPANGAIVGLELADGLRGQEVGRVETRGFILGMGVADRVSVSLARTSGHLPSPHILGGNDEVGPPEDPAGALWRAGVRVRNLLGRANSSTSLHLARTGLERVDLPAQWDHVSTIDVAVPTEFPLTECGRPGCISVYGGPRITRERYTDHVDLRQSLQNIYYGALGGLHLQYGSLHVFAEATVLHVPASQFKGVTYGGRYTVMPAIGVTAVLGQTHQWHK